MRDEKVCPTCGGDLIWKGNVLDGALTCEHCLDGKVAIDWAATNALDLMKEAAEWDDLGLRPQLMGQEQFELEYMSGGRRAGRTHGMVMRALNEASKGEDVIILVNNWQMVEYIRGMIYSLGVEATDRTFRVPSYMHDKSHYGSLRVLMVSSNPRGVNRTAKVFADHTVFESRRKDRFWHWREYYEIKS